MTLSLDRLQPGQSASVVELRSSDPARLDRLSTYGVLPGSRVTLHQLHPALVFRIGATELSLDLNIAREIIVCLDN